MRKFLSRLRNKQIKKKKVRKYLINTLDELFLVVLGILIALQVNKWYGERKDHQQETIILSDLKQEYLGKLEEINHKIALRDQISDSASKLLEMIAMDSLSVSRDSLNKLVIYTLFKPTFNASNNVTDELIHSGNLYLISKRKLRLLLTDWSGQLEKLLEEEQRLNMVTLLHYEPYIRERYPFNTLVSDIFNENELIWRTNLRDLNLDSYYLAKSKKEVDLQALWDDYAFESYLAATYMACAFGNLQSKEIRSFILEVLEVIENEIESR